MRVLLRIAFRNLREHTSKSVIIGSLIVLGVVIVVLGNALLDSTERGVHRMFIDNYTGDVFISGVPKTNGATVSLFGVTSTQGGETTPLLPAFDAIANRLRADPRTGGLAGQVTGMGLVTVEGTDEQTMSFLFGVDPATYPVLFRDTFIVEGRYLEPGEEGLVVSRGWLAQAEKELKKPVKLGDAITFTGFGFSGVKIREVTIVGVVDFGAETEGMNMIAWANADTVRILGGVDVSAEDIILSAEQTELLDAASEEDIFGAPERTVDAASARAAGLAPQAPSSAEGTAAAARPTDAGSWHFLLVRLKNPRQAEAFIAETNAWLADQGIAARAGGWKAAAGPFSQSIDVIRIVFYVAIIIVAIVAIIIIMNTLVISVIERTGEIGTMRALGAQKPFVWLMFLVETLTITVVFGVIGIGIATAAIGVINLIGIPAGSYFTQVLFGGKVLRLIADPVAFLTAILVVAGVGLVSHLYPVLVALKIPPVQAMQNE
jgi:putative ABC transport system permease protein